MSQLREAGVGVVVVSWTPPNSAENTDAVMPDLLDIANRHGIKVAIHVEPYDGRNPINLMENIRYLFNQYGSHPALHRIKRNHE